MKKFALIIAVVLGLLLASCTMNINPANSSKVDLGDKGEVVNGVIYGKVNGYEILEHRLLIGYTNRDAVDKVVKELGGTIYKELPKIKVVAVNIPMTVEEAMKTLKVKKWEGIRYIEPSYKRDLIDPNPGKFDDSITRAYGDYPDVGEELWSELWGMQVVNAPEAWKEATGTGVVVAVVDTPIDGQHPDLVGQFVTGYDPGDAYGHEATEIAPNTDYEDPNNPEDDHGTHVAGTIAAKKDGKGVVGLAYGAKIMPILIFRGYYDEDGNPSYYYIGDEYVADGIIWAVDHGADVLSNSWGGGGYSYTLKAAIDYALSHGAVFVAAAGNGHTDQHWHYPSAYPGVIAVAASTAGDKVVNFSNRGDYVSVAAPGVNVLSTVPHLADYGIKAYDGKGRYDYWGGTSMATPHAAALAALLKQKYPDATPYQIKKMIEHSAVDIDETGWDHAAGYGRIDAEKVLEENPNDYHGAVYHVVVASKDAGFGIPAALITLKRKGGDGGDYYAATDGYGVATFYGIDPDDYDVIIGGPDLYESNSPILRMEEQTGTKYATSLSAGEATDVAYFDTYFGFIVDMNASDTLHFIHPGYYLVYGAMVDLTSPYEAKEATTVALKFDVGQADIAYEIPTPAESTITVYATAVVNGYAIPISGQIGIGATWTVLDDAGGIGLWWTAF